LQSNKHHVLFILLLLLGYAYINAQETKVIPLNLLAKDTTITAPLLLKVLPKDSLWDTMASDNMSTTPALLLDKISYKAKDFVRLSKRENKIYLYNEAALYYQDTELKAGVIIMDYLKNEVYAGRLKDSLGNYSQLPYFKQGTNVVIPDSIRFNFTTQKAIIWNSRTEQQATAGNLGNDAMKVYATITKKENDSVYFLSEAKLTTSKDTINPDYYIRIKKAKFVPKKKVIAGTSILYIQDVPTPILLPFAYFPLSTGRSAGILMPSFGNDPNTGYFLQDMGYYVPIGDYADITLSGDFYTNGSWGVRTASIYTKRYKYRGNVNFRYENLVTSQRGFSDYSFSRNYNIQISHTQDTKASANSRFSASVNLGSSEYFRNSLQQSNLPNTQNNTLSSSVSYSKTFPAYPSINMSLTATHSQLTSATVVDESVNNISMTLPTFQASIERIFPFATRDGIKKGALQNINLQYNINAQNSLTTNDTDFLTSRMFDNAKVGARNSIPLSTNFKIAKFFSVSMGATYEDTWTMETYIPRYDLATESTVIDTVSGFDRYNKYNFNASIGTTLYGTFNFGDDKKIQAIRHVLRPSINYGYAPSFEQFYDEYLDANGELVQFSRFAGTLNGAPSLRKSNSLSFSLANTLEAKVRDKDSTATEAKKIPILGNFNIRSTYNLESDSLKLSPLNINGGTTLLDNKMAVNFSVNLDPYALDNNGIRINTLNINNGGSFLRLTSANTNISYAINSEMFKKKNKKRKSEANEDKENPFDYVAQSGGRSDDLFGRANDFSNPNTRDSNNKQDVENPVYGTKIPWNFRLAYSANYLNSARQDEFGSQSLMFSGDIELSPRWKVGGSSGYDFKNAGFTLTQLRFERNLKSFNMRFNWTPFGQYKRWFFFIGIDASILSDLKWENRSQVTRN